MHFYEKIPKKNLYKKIINILNGTLELTEREKQVILVLIQLDLAWTPTFRDDYKNILSTDNRRTIMKETNIHKANLVKYIRKFKDRNLIIKNDQGGWEIHPVILKPPIGGIVEIAYTLEIDDYNVKDSTKTVV